MRYSDDKRQRIQAAVEVLNAELREVRSRDAEAEVQSGAWQGKGDNQFLAARLVLTLKEQML